MKLFTIAAIVQVVCVLIAPAAARAATFEDPTKGKPFFPWIWQDQFRPTLTNSLDFGGIGVLSGGAVGTIAAHYYDDDIQRSNAKGDHLIFTSEASGDLSIVGGGGVGIGIAVLQLFFDQKNGLMHGRALALTSLSQVALSYAVQRHRPPGRDDYLPFPSSFPSGHSASAFATAESLAYAYGWWAGVPANLVAAAVATARVSENAHWFSDVVAGAALGIFWAHASHNVDELSPSSTSAWQVVPVPLDDGLALSASSNF